MNDLIATMMEGILGGGIGLWTSNIVTEWGECEIQTGPNITNMEGKTYITFLNVTCPSKGYKIGPLCISKHADKDSAYQEHMKLQKDYVLNPPTKFIDIVTNKVYEIPQE